MTSSQRPNRASKPTHNRVLIVTDDPSALRPLVGTLRQKGFDLQTVGYDGSELDRLPPTPPSAILCFLTDYIEHSERIVSELREAFSPREIPIIGELAQGRRGLTASDLPYDSVLFRPVHPSQVAHRLTALIRLRQMEKEVTRRIETFRKDFGQDIILDDTNFRRPFKVLFIGKADPSYMIVINALKDKIVDVTAAFTSFSAFDYLHDNAFDAVIMNARDQSEPALTISQTMRRNSKLFHVPTLFLVDGEIFPDTTKAFEYGAKDLIDLNASAEEISGRILELANYHRLHQALKSQFDGLGGAACTDPETGVFNGDFLSAHLARVSRNLREKALPLTILTLKLIPSSQGNVAASDLRQAFTKATRLIAGLVRMQDIVARLDIDTLVIAFPEETEASINTVLDRMKGLIECAAFETSAGDNSPLTLEIDAAIIEQEAHESADFLIGAAQRSVDQDGVSLTPTKKTG